MQFVHYYVFLFVFFQQVGQLYEEGVRRERSSDSSRRTHTISASQANKRPQWNYAPRLVLVGWILAKAFIIQAESKVGMESYNFNFRDIITKIGLCRPRDMASIMKAWF